MRRCTADERDARCARRFFARRGHANIDAAPLPSTDRHIFMSIPAKSYQLADGDELQLFIYADVAARE